MKLALRILVTALVAALLAVPTATAKPGGGHGKGGGKGKPAWAGGGKGAEKSKGAHGKKADKAGKSEKAKKAKKAKKHGQAASEQEACEAPAALADALGALFGADDPACEPEGEDEAAAELTAPPELEGLGPGQYCHALEAWMASNGGDFSSTFGTEGSGYANDHGKCASRRAHGEDLLAAATDALPAQEPAEEEQEAEQLTLLAELEGLGPGQYCHALEAWMAANGGDFSTTFGTEGSGYANDHGKCASRRAHGEDLAPLAQQATCAAAEAAGGELPEECKEEEPAAPAGGDSASAGEQTEATGDLATLLRLFSF